MKSPARRQPANRRKNTAWALLSAGWLALPASAAGAAPDVFLLSGCDAGDRSPEAVIRPILEAAEACTSNAALRICYPFAGSQFPPEIIAPEILWEDHAGSEAWLLTARFGSGSNAIHVLCDGKRAPPEIDPRCVRGSNAFEEAPIIASARGWRPSEATWDVIKRSSITNALRLTIRGLKSSGGERRPVSHGSVSFSTSADPVGAPLFYRDVPLMPNRTKDGVVKPLADDAIPLIQWRLRNISEPAATTVLKDMPTCANCHSFSADGKYLSMDVDGPDGDKGAHTVIPVGKRMSIHPDDVFSWNRDRGQNPGAPLSYGLFPQISPDGRYVAATIREQLYVQNYMNLQFLQTFYPTRGILAVHDRSTGNAAPLPGADDPRFVQSNPVWSPDGREIVFVRAEARDSYGAGPRSRYANDPNETQIRYDLYRIPFNGGRGGMIEPLVGASHNGKSNSFPKFSPDGRWIVFVQAANALLMRPDSKLCIIAASGGQPRLMTCNMEPMNSWHTWSPNGRWLAFSSKAFGPYTRLFLAHVDGNGIDSPAVLLPNCTAANRAVNLPEFVNIPPGGIQTIATPAVAYRRLLKQGKDLALAGDLAQAQRRLQESLALKPEYADTHVAWGFVMDSLGRPEEAIAGYRRAIELDPENEGAHRYLAQTSIKRGDFSSAFEHLQAALQIDPLDDEALRFLGDAHALTGATGDAERCYRRALAFNEGNAYAHNNLANLLVQTSRLEEALAHYEASVRHKPGYASGYANQGVVLARLGKSLQAVECYRKALQIDPSLPAAHCNLALLLARKDDPAVHNPPEALRSAEKACALTGHRNVRCLLALAEAHAANNNLPEARRAADLAISLLPPDSPEAAEIRNGFLPSLIQQ